LPPSWRTVDWLVYLLQAWLPATRNWSQAGTNTLAEAQTGDGTKLMVLPVFVAPALPSGAVSGEHRRAHPHSLRWCRTIKNSGKCSDTRCRPPSASSAAPNPARTGPPSSPSFTVSHRRRAGGHQMELGRLRRLSGLPCEIQVDRGDGKGFVLLTIDTTPGYTDTQPFPAARTVWTYRAIYQVNDARVGVWSQSVSVAVPA
jgi:hypothetical protein